MLASEDPMHARRRASPWWLSATFAEPAQDLLTSMPPGR
jgi:hypothetical protein